MVRVRLVFIFILFFFLIWMISGGADNFFLFHSEMTNNFI